MNIKKQIEAAIELLKNQGRSESEIQYFQVFAEGLAQKAVSGFAQNFGKLCELANLNEDPDDPDARAKIKFPIHVTMDITDLDVCDIVTDLVYSEKVIHRTRSANQVMVREVLEKQQEIDEGQIDFFTDEPETVDADLPEEQPELTEEQPDPGEPKAEESEQPNLDEEKKEEPAPAAEQA